MAAAPTTTYIHHNGGDDDKLEYYPAFCHKASPTYFTWVKMAVTDVHRLKTLRGFEGQSLYFYKNHPIKFLCLAGVIVSRDEQDRRSILVLDDSTGSTIEVVCDKPTPSLTTERASDPLLHVRPQAQTEATKSAPSIGERILAEGETGPTHLAAATRTALDITPLVPGAVAKVRGTISRFRGMLQLHLERYAILPDTNAEIRFWEERTRFLVDVLCVPWVLSDDEVRRLKRECDEEEKHHVKKRVFKEKQAERVKRKAAEREEKDRLRIERRYAREEEIRRRLAAECAEASRDVGAKRKAK